MKRTPLKPRTTRPRAKRKGTRRVSVDRIPEYRSWLNWQRCAACLTKLGTIYVFSNGPIDAAHTSNNGRSSKGPDSGCLPLCRGHHLESHRIGVKDFEARYQMELKATAGEYFTRWQEQS